MILMIFESSCFTW